MILCTCALSFPTLPTLEQQARCLHVATRANDVRESSPKEIPFLQSGHYATQILLYSYETGLHRV